MNQIYGPIIGLAILVTCVSLSFPAPVRGDEALQRYNDGIALYKSEKYTAAAKAFREAYALKASWKLYYNIGQAEAAARRYDMALDAFEAYLVEGGDDIDGTRREFILKEIEGFKLLVGTLEVMAPPQTALYVDGERRGTTPFPGAIRIAAGTHVCTLKRDEEVLLEKTVRILGETNTVLEIEAPASEERADAPPDTSTQAPAVSPPPPSTTEARRGTTAKTIAGIVTGGVGLAGVGVGIAFAVKAIDDQASANEEKHGDIDEFNKRLTTFHTSQAVYIAGFAAGGALLATGIILIVLDVVSKKRAEEPKSVFLIPVPGGVAGRF